MEGVGAFTSTAGRRRLEAEWMALIQAARPSQVLGRACLPCGLWEARPAGWECGCGRGLASQLQTDQWPRSIALKDPSVGCLMKHTFQNFDGKSAMRQASRDVTGIELRWTHFSNIALLRLCSVIALSLPSSRVCLDERPRIPVPLFQPWAFMSGEIVKRTRPSL